MMKRMTLVVLLCLSFLHVLSGCAAQERTYREGVLATDFWYLSRADLQQYAIRLDEEKAAIEKGAPVPAGISREIYLKDLGSRREVVRKEIIYRGTDRDAIDALDDADRASPPP